MSSPARLDCCHNYIRGTARPSLSVTRPLYPAFYHQQCIQFLTTLSMNALQGGFLPMLLWWMELHQEFEASLHVLGSVVGGGVKSTCGIYRLPPFNAPPNCATIIVTFLYRWSLLQPFNALVFLWNTRHMFKICTSLVFAFLVCRLLIFCWT